VTSGVNAEEFDLRIARDGVLALLHGQTLDRTTNGSGPVAIRLLSR
jgi:glycerophosphoryl diester phosphodiesterase